MKLKNNLETGCIFDGVHGIHNFERVCSFAKWFGWDGVIPPTEDIEVMMDAEDEATEWLNLRIAEEGFLFGWHEGSYYYWSYEDWQSLV